MRGRFLTQRRKGAKRYRVSGGLCAFAPLREKDFLNRAMAKLHTIEDKTLKLSTAIIEGPPRQVIVDEAENWHADLIVIGSRGLAAWNRLLLGSVSSGVVHYARCSVEIVRLPAAPVA